MNTRTRAFGRFTLKKIFRYFLQGLLILAPIAITIWAIVAAFNFIDGILPNLVYNIFPSLIGVDSSGNPKRIPGLGFIVIIIVVVLVGWISSNLLMGSLINIFDSWMERTPVIKFIYSSLKDFFEAFAGDKRKFNKAVLASVFADDVWIVGFLTDEEMQKFNMGANLVGVYVPQAYNFAGQLYILPREKVRAIDKISSGEAMKYAVTGGVIDLAAEEKHEKEKAAALDA
jgi:uncharacterized membrane protein